MPSDFIPQHPPASSPPPATFRPSPLNPNRSLLPSSGDSTSSLHTHAMPPADTRSPSANPATYPSRSHSSNSGSSHDGSNSSVLAGSAPRLRRDDPASQPLQSSRRPPKQSRDSYAHTYGAPVSASGPDAGSLNAIAAGLVGGSYGPFPHELTAGGMSRDGAMNSVGSSSASRASMMATGGARGFPARWSGAPPIDYHKRASSISGSETLDFMPSLSHQRPRSAMMGTSGTRESFMSTGSAYESDSGGLYSGTGGETTEDLLWKDENKEPDDYLHDPDPVMDQQADKRVALWSRRGWANVLSLVILIVGLIALFAFWPIAVYVIGRVPGVPGWNMGGINGSGQYPDIPNLPTLVDKDTPQGARSRTGFDGHQYDLVFSDEFNLDGRTFWPGDDPYWEAVDLHYWQTTNFEWYDPDAVVTKNGALEIALTEQPLHDLGFKSGMLQSWNQFCFTEGYIEVNVSLPGKASVQGLWPGAWTMGNLARAGFGASNDGLWPYSYSACDVGTLPNQTNPDGVTPAAAKNSGDRDYGGELSYLKGQRVSACTCKGEDHPGPNNGVGRSGPEIDIIEAQYGYGPTGALGSVSQSMQIAPMDAAYAWDNTSTGITIDSLAASGMATSGTLLNRWHGSINQESLSGITITDGTSYEGAGWQTFGFEYKRGFSEDGAYITWSYNGGKTWTINAAAIGANAAAEISARPVSMEPMYIILNLGLSNKFQIIEWDKIPALLPAKYLVDYVRVYQRSGSDPQIGCNPKDYPTTHYIEKHLAAYTNPNATTWQQAGFSWPKNKLKDNC